MADYRRTATGNWSTLAQWQEWNGSTWVAASGLPTTGDRCFANNFTTTLDSPATITVTELNNGTGGLTGVTNGGTFTFGTTTTVNADCRIGSVNTSTLQNTTGVMKFVNGTMYGSALGNTANGTLSGSWITFNGFGIAGSQQNTHALVIGSDSNITGTFTGGSGLAAFGLLINGSNNILSGNFNGGGGNVSNGLTISTGINNTATGTATGGSFSGARGIEVSSSGSLVLNGLVIGGTSGAGAVNSSNGTLIVTKATASINVVGIIGSVAGGTTIISEAENASNGRQACEGFVRFSNTGQLKYTVTKQNGSTQLLTDNSTVNYPAEADVRNLVQYGPGNIYTGTLVPDITPQDIFTAIANSSDPIAVRLRNVATVQTTGDQIAAAL